MNDAKLRVFISYARRDCSAFAEELLAGLEVAGFDPFLDRHDIAAGEDWEVRLGGLIHAADTVVFVVSPGAVSSERCAWEVAKAEALSKRIIPVVAMEVPEAEAPTGLKRLNYIFFSEGHSFARSLGELAKALRVDLAWIREHTRLGELAARWRDRDKAEALLLRGSELQTAKVWLAAWKAGAPEATDLHRTFIGESEAGERKRLLAEKRRGRNFALLGIVIGGLMIVIVALAMARADVLRAQAQVAEMRVRVERVEAENSGLHTQIALLNTELRRLRGEQPAMDVLQQTLRRATAPLTRGGAASPGEPIR